MIDTIHFRINNVNENYSQLVEQLATADRTGTSSFEVEKDFKSNTETSRIRSVLYHDYDNIIPLERRSNLFVPSSHYTVSYFINHIAGYIDFNVSIPKYYYSTNVLQYINYYNQNSETLLLLLTEFFDNFFRRHSIQKIDYYDLEVRRIDICYNQFFLNKNDALNYLKHQKELNAKYARSSKNNFRSYDTSLMYVTDRYSFKIYHKGTEFKKNDYKQLRKANPLGLDLKDIQYQADRILRYEMTLRSSYLNYLFKQNILKKKKDSIYHFFFKYVRYNGTKLKLSIANSGKGALYNNFNLDNLMTFQDDFLNKSVKFCIRSKWQTFADLSKYNERPLSYVYSQVINELFYEMNVPFDMDLCDLIFDAFWQKVSDYQLNIKMSIHEVQNKIDASNLLNQARNTLRSKSKHNKDKSRLTVLAMLSQYMDIKNLKTVIPERTLRDWKKDLKDIGINMYNDNSDIPPPKTDYQEYKYYFGVYHQMNLENITKSEIQTNALEFARNKSKLAEHFVNNNPFTSKL